MKSTRLLLWTVVCLALAVGFAATSFAEEEATDELVGLVVGLLADKDKDIRALGYEQIRSSAKGKAATKQFAAQLPKLSADAKVGLLSALADRRDKAARPAVLEVLKTSRVEPVRVAAIGALSRLGELADSRLLIELLSDTSKTVKGAARKSLIDLAGEKVPAAIAAHMNQAEPPLHVVLIEILSARRALETLPEILPAAVDADPNVRAAAMKALGKLGSQEHLPGMVQGVLKAANSRERAAAEKNVMFVCARIKDPEKRAAPLLAAIKKLKEADRRVMLSTLGRVGGSAALKIVEEAIDDADSKLHGIGLKALCNWPDTSVAPRLIKLARSDPHPSHRISALRAVIRVAPLRDKRSDAQRLELLKNALAMATRDKERNLVLDRARAIRTLDALRFITPFMDQPLYAKQACLSVVELAHHRSLREPNKAEFHRSLDKVIQTSKDATVVDRAKRYKKDQTWVRPAKGK